MVAEAACAGKAGLAEWTGNVSSSVGPGVDHLEVVAILEIFVTWLTVILVMAFDLHVLLSHPLGVNLDGTNLAGKPWCPMIQGINMLLGCVYGTEHARASITFIPWSKVTRIVHVLLAGAGTVELFGASLALIHPEGDVMIPE